MRIKPGDTLSAIARQNKTTVARLLELNPQIKDASKIIAGRELKLPTDGFVQTPPRANAPSSTQQQGANPAIGYAHSQFLRQQLATLPQNDPLRADLAKDLQLLNRAALGQLVLPEQTKAIVDQVTRGLGPEERDIVLAKAFELTSEGFSVEKTGGPRFAANLALEISEYVATGANASAALLDQTTQLVRDAEPVFAEKPQLEEQLLGNLFTGMQNQLARAGMAVTRPGLQ